VTKDDPYFPNSAVQYMTDVKTELWWFCFAWVQCVLMVCSPKTPWPLQHHRPVLIWLPNRTCRSWRYHSVNMVSGRQLGWGYRVARLKGRSGSCSTLHLMGSQQFQTSLVAMEMSTECNQLLSSDYLWIGLQCFDGNVKPLSMDAPHAWCNDWCLQSCMLYV